MVPTDRTKHIVSSVCRSAYHQLRQLRPIVCSLSVDVAKTLVQAFVSSRLNYCNYLLIGITDDCRQSRMPLHVCITGTRRRDHITPILRQLHWLPVRQRVEFKLAMSSKAYMVQPNSTPVDDCQIVTASGRRQLRSTDANMCVIQRTRTYLSDRSFAVAGPRLWNSLLVGLHHLNFFIGQPRSALKTHYFVALS